MNALIGKILSVNFCVPFTDFHYYHLYTYIYIFFHSKVIKGYLYCFIISVEVHMLLCSLCGCQSYVIYGEENLFKKKKGKKGLLLGE